MREIKFRAHVIRGLCQGQVLNVVTVDFRRREVYCNSEGNYSENSLIYSLGDVELMQFTGRHDKHGTEIFAADRTRWDGGEYVVEWSGFYGWILKDDREDWDCPNLYEVSSPAQTRIEVIGNIYANPDLVEKDP